MTSTSFLLAGDITSDICVNFNNKTIKLMFQ